MNHDNQQKGWQLELILIIAFLIVTTYFLIYHKEHLLGILQYIFWPLFIFIHFFMHRSHGGHGNKHNDDSDYKNK
jgi:hypothetical protein